MKNRFPDLLSDDEIEAAKVVPKKKKPSAVEQKLNALASKIAKLELVILNANKKDNRPWIFETERTSDGRITKVVAQREGDVSRVLQ